MPYIPEATIAEIKKIDLLTYLQTYEPDELVHISGNEYTTKTHSSLKISNGIWHWHSQGKAGKTALQYLIEVKGMNFMAAAEILMNEVAAVPPVFTPESIQTERKEFQLPKPNADNSRVITYLSSRGIDKEIIDFCIQTKRLYESSPYHNAVFVGHDETGTAHYAFLRGTGESRFMGDVAGSDKRYSFSFTSETLNNRLHIFESAIDLLSYATAIKLKNQNFRQSNLLSLGGVSKKAESEPAKLPLALEHVLKQHTNISAVYLHLDNDEAGRSATSAIMTALPKHISAVDIPPTHGKDVNDTLMQYFAQNKQRGNSR